jgi:hypothetical protein
MATAEPDTAPAKDDDMHDSQDERRAPFPLGAYLSLCDPCADGNAETPCLRADFDDADREALSAQKKYGAATLRAARWGLIALLIALFQEFFLREWLEHLPEVLKPFAPYLRWLVLGFEILYTGATLYLVLQAISAKNKEKWLSERFKAERLRLLKFKLLIDPVLWRSDTKDLAQIRGLLETERRSIVNQPEDIIHAFKGSEEMPDIPRRADCEKVPPDAMAELLEYYRRERLSVQRDYFEERLRRPRGATENETLGPIFFFAGIACALFYLILELATAGMHTWNGELVGRGLLFASFLFPLGWSAVRTVKSAHQATRNRLRSFARHADLTQIEKALNEETLRPPADWDRTFLFTCLSACEGVLSIDQHEWIRLMIDAEWYG